MNNSETIQKINHALQELRSAHELLKVAVELVRSKDHLIDTAFADGLFDLETTIAALESWRGFIEKNGDQITFEFLHDYDTANSWLVRFLSWLALPAFLETWIAERLYHRTQKKLARFLAGKRLEGAIGEVAALRGKDLL